MKISICSDLHLEIADLELKNTDNADVLVLAGDIIVENSLQEWSEDDLRSGHMTERSQRYYKFFEQVCKEFPTVVYIAGNHESYLGDIATTYDSLKRKLSHYPNLRILDCERFDLGKYTFVGSTLWTDMNNEDVTTMIQITRVMNDFRIIKNSNRSRIRKIPTYERDSNGKCILGENGRPKITGFDTITENVLFSPEDSVEIHRRCLGYINEVCSTDPTRTYIVVGHHSPSYKSCAPRYINDKYTNGGFHTELSDFILDRPQIKLWIHGHTHDEFDYTIGDCRVVCNPRGYLGYESRANKFELKTIEI